MVQRLYLLDQARDSDLPRVILSTFHSSKGLEWDHVFLLEFYGGSVPKADELSPHEAWEEERRCAYVAMTRARDHLTIYTRAHQPASEFLADAGLGVPELVAA